MTIKERIDELEAEKNRLNEQLKGKFCLVLEGVILRKAIRAVQEQLDRLYPLLD